LHPANSRGLDSSGTESATENNLTPNPLSIPIAIGMERGRRDSERVKT